MYVLRYELEFENPFNCDTKVRGNVHIFREMGGHPGASIY
jgi:hypothetical protein